MRLNRLDLLRYGRFSDANITFPRPTKGMPDVTVVFGQNEAGKSTAFNALLELFFGFAAKSHPYAFRFERRDLVVGAELDLPERGIMVLRRNSKKTHSLLDENDRPISDGILSRALHGLTREQYEDRFSLNETGMREGGKRIAEAKGDLGQLLHAGVSGLTDMAKTLESLDARADKFHKRNGRRTLLANGKARLTEIARELKTDCLSAERERKLRKDREQTLGVFQTANDECQQARKRQAASEAAQVWYDKGEQLANIEAVLATCPSGPTLPNDVRERVASLVEKMAAQLVRITEANEGIATQGQAIEAQPIDELALPLKTELDRLDKQSINGAPLMESASTARVKLKQLRGEQDKLGQQIDDVVNQLKMPIMSPSSIALESGELEELTLAVQECVKASHASDAALHNVDASRATQGEAPSEPQDLNALKAAFNAWQSVSDISAEEAAKKQAEASFKKVTAGLPKSWEDLVANGLPASETLGELNDEWARLKADLATASENLETCSAERADASAALSSLEDAPETVDIAKTEETRRERDNVWQQHRGNLNDKTADQFEEAMYADDSTRARYSSGAEARQRLSTTQAQAKAVEGRYKKAKARHDKLLSQHDMSLTRCDQIARKLGFEEGTVPSAFKARHTALESSATAAADLSNAEEALRDCLERRNKAFDELTHEAHALALDTSRSDLSDQVQRALNLEQSDRKAWDEWQKADKSIEKLEAKSKQRVEDLTQAQLKLQELTAALPLKNRSLEAIQDALPSLRSMSQLYGKHKDLAGQVEILEQTNAAITASAERLAKIMQEPEDAIVTDPVQTINSARNRVTLAKQCDEKRATAEERKCEYDISKRRAETEQKNAQDKLNDIFKEQGGEDFEPQERVAKLVERDRLRLESATAENDQQKAREGVNEDLFSEELPLMPDATRATQLKQAEQDALAVRDTALAAHRDAERMYNEAFATDERAELATERATILEGLSNDAREAVVARLGALAARGALRRLAAERRSDMLRDVENAFVAMTKPAWKGVDAWTQSEGDKLVGIQPDGKEVPVNNMSTGTMGQLYFALRLAGYRSFAREPGPLPMILDDIMETFDDSRARAALQLCADIGANGQAILFTHHAHLVELARDTIDGVAVVNMPERGVEELVAVGTAPILKFA